MAEDLFLSGKKPEYPWQLELPPWAPQAKPTQAERRADLARFLFGSEKTYRGEGWGRHPLLFHDAPRDLFHFYDGGFALSRTHANWPALKEAGFFSGWGM